MLPLKNRTDPSAKQNVAPAVDGEIREPDRRVVRADHEVDVLGDHPLSDRRRLARLTLVIRCEQHHLAARLRQVNP